MRVNRYDYWFPLALLGFLLLGLAVWRPATEVGWFAYAPGNSTRFLAQTAVTGIGDYDAAGWFPVSWADLLTVVVAFLVAATWYAARARRANGGVSAGRLVALVLGVPAAGVAAYLLLFNVKGLFENGKFAAALTLPLLAVGACAGVSAYFLRGRWRRVAAAVAVLLVSVGVVAVAAPADHGAGVVVLAAGLFTLAWLHRSVLAAVAGALFLLTSAGGSLTDPAAYVVPAAVLLAVAISALVLRARPGDTQWTMER